MPGIQATITSNPESESRVDPIRAPLVREFPADLETPVSIYMKLMGQGPSFLLESVTGGEQVARYSFIGVGPSRAYVLRQNEVECFSALEPTEAGPAPSTGVLYPLLKSDCRLSEIDDPLDVLRGELTRYQHTPLPGLPRFSGGLVGYFSYEMSRFFEPSLQLEAHLELPEAIFLMADTLVAFDHARGRLLLIANLPLQEEFPALDSQPKNGRDPCQAFTQVRAAAEARLDALEQRIQQPLSLPPNAGLTLKSRAGGVRPLHSNMTPETFKAAVEEAKEYIAAGDIFQVVLSQRLSRTTQAQPFQIYRALRRLNPSPYMFYFDFDTLAGNPPLRLIGASPEVHVRLEGRTASLRPIAGTRLRGQTPAEDLQQEQDLLADPKERAEHVMLVDLGRNDLGRVCEFGSVNVPEFMVVERYSHVMHIVSQVQGTLRAELDGFDLLRATFPAGTVSGAPKIRAMQIIDELEKTPRGPYAGAVGYFSFDGAIDTCITIRTLTMRGQTISVQAGAGVVADSDPQREYQETLNKALALALAVENAEGMPVGNLHPMSATPGLGDPSGTSQGDN